MSTFDLFPAEAAAKLERRSAADEGPSFFEGALSAPIYGAAKGLVVERAREFNLALSHIPAAIDEAFGTNSRDWWFDNMMLERASRKVSPNPREVGTAGQMLHALFDIGATAATTGPAGVLVQKTVGGAMEGAEEGLDTLTAMKKGAIEGGAAAIGVGLPINVRPLVGLRISPLKQQLAYGVAANVPIGVAQRALTHEVLADAGYKDMAEQYKALDEGALLTDFALGLAFGGLGHVLNSKGVRFGALEPADVDAALAKRNAYHLEVDTAPGLAKNGETRDSHVDSMLKATEDLMDGRPVDVTETLRATEFEANPAVDRTRAQLAGEIEKVAAPIRRAAEDMERVEQERVVAETARSEEPIPPERTAQIEAALKAEGSEVTPENVHAVELIARARALDAPALDALPSTISDEAYLAKARDIVAVADDDLGHAAQFVRSNPEAPIAADNKTLLALRHKGVIPWDVDENGQFIVNVVSARELLKHANELIDQARIDGRGVLAAANCAAVRGL